MSTCPQTVPLCERMDYLTYAGQPPLAHACRACASGEHYWRDLGPVSECECCRLMQSNCPTVGQSNREEKS